FIKFIYFILYKKVNNIEKLIYTFFKIVIINYSLFKKRFNKNNLFIIKFYKSFIS
ncbi:hypothetical protein CORC01_10234, partial [Colletotrichum orchidophilum]